MRVLLDECVPTILRHHLPSHDVRSVKSQGWSGIKNGALLALMQADGFEVLLTVDQNLRFQQNLATTGVAVLVMMARTNSIPDLVALVPDVAAALNLLKPGDVVEVGGP